VRGALASVDATAHLATTVAGDELPYTALLVAVGARANAWLPGAITFGLTGPGAGMPALLHDLDDGAVSSVAFVVPSKAFWAPLVYELALLTAEHVRTRSLAARVSLVTAEAAPLALFGPRASLAITRRLRRDGIELQTATAADAAQADRVVTMPMLSGPSIDGLPMDRDGFVPVDGRGHVVGATDVFAAGDAAALSIKQHGLTAGEADTAAQAILGGLGLQSRISNDALALDGSLLVDEDLLDGARLRSIWWPPPELAARRLSTYLRVMHGDRRSVDVAPPPGSVPVHIDV
jgi:sulfide:quinone oxidoreductase